MADKKKYTIRVRLEGRFERDVEIETQHGEAHATREALDVVWTRAHATPLHEILTKDDAWRIAVQREGDLVRVDHFNKWNVDKRLNEILTASSTAERITNGKTREV